MSALPLLPDGERFRVLLFKQLRNSKAFYHVTTHDRLKAVLVSPYDRYGFARKKEAVIDFIDAFNEQYRFETGTKDHVEFVLQRRVNNEWVEYYCSDKSLEYVTKKKLEKEEGA